MKKDKPWGDGISKFFLFFLAKLVATIPSYVYLFLPNY
jgi:hypothetical protein